MWANEGINVTKTEYLESKRGQSYSDIIAQQPMETVQGSLLKKHYQELKTILGAGGLRLHLNTFVADTPEKMFALTAVNETFTEQYMADPDFKVNFTVQEVLDTFNAVVALGVIPTAISQELVDLAKYERPQYHITFKDCVAYFEANSLVVSPPVTIDVTGKNRVLLNLTSATPELAAVRLEIRESHDGQTWSHWNRITPIIVKDAGVYYHTIPSAPNQRELRWSGEDYRINGTLEAI